MLLQDLFEKIEPGQMRAIELQIDKYEKAIKDLERQEDNLASLDYDDYKIAGAEKELEDLKQAYQKYVDDLKAKLAADKKGKGADSFERYMAAIVRHCPTIVKMCQETNLLLYRGVKERAPAFYASPFTKREPKDSNREIHDAWNYAMDAMGVKAKRDNSTFTITSRGHASNFGDQVYIVFFRDPFNFTWSDSIKDLVLDTEKMIDMVDPETVKSVMGYVWDNENLREKYKTAYRYISLESSSYDVKFDKDRYPSGDSYDGYIFMKYNFSNSLKAFKQILPDLPSEFKKYESFNAWVSPEKITENFGLHYDEDLQGAFLSGHEITITSNYYAVRLDLEKKVRKYLGMSQYSP